MTIWKIGYMIPKRDTDFMNGVNWRALIIAAYVVLGLLCPMIFLPIEAVAAEMPAIDFSEVFTCELIPHEQNGLWGYVDSNGVEIIPSKWSAAGWHRGGTAAVCSIDGYWGIIDNTGEYLVPCQYDAIYDQYSYYECAPFDDPNGYIGGLNDGFYIVVEYIDDEEYLGFYCIETKVLVEPEWCSVTIAAPNEGTNELILVEDWYDGFGYVDRQGNVVIGCQYEWATPFLNGSAIVEFFANNDYYECYIDTTGRVIDADME